MVPVNRSSFYDFGSCSLSLLILISGYFGWHTRFKDCSHMLRVFCHGFVFTPL